MDEKKMKFLNARDTILAFLLAKDFTREEIKEVLQMCNDEVDAWENRSKIVEINKDGDDNAERD